MRAHGRVFTGLFAVALLAGAVVVANAPAHATSPTPTLTIKMRAGGRVEVHWSFASTGSRSGLRLEVERNSDAPGAHAVVFTRNRPRPTGMIRDTAQPGMVTYRARLTVRGVAQDWGPSFSARLVPPPPPSSTTTTTVRPTTTTTTVAKPPPPTNDMPPGFSECPATWVPDVIRAVNQERAKVGSPAVTSNATLQLAAHMRAIQMGKTQTLDHSGLPAVAAATGAAWWGEIIIVNNPTPDGAVASFMSSPPHRQILLYTGSQIGAGCVYDDKRGSDSHLDPNKGNVWISLLFG